MKCCTKCETLKALTEYHRDSSKTSGFRSECKTCHKLGLALSFLDSGDVPKVIPLSLTKTCVRCGEVKGTEYFHKRSKSIDGFHPYCKTCVKLQSAKAYPKVAEVQAARSKEYRFKNKLLIAEKRAAKISEDKVAHREYHRAYQKSHPEARRINEQNRRARMKGRLSPYLGSALLVKQNGKCACCGASLADGYHLDHILPLALGGLNVDENIQLLTPRCNSEKSDMHPNEFMRLRRPDRLVATSIT